MSQGWVFFRVSADIELAVPQDRVFRILHRGDPEYQVYEPSALHPHLQFGIEPDPSLPGVLAIFSSGACWAVGDAAFGDSKESLTYLTVPQDLFGGRSTWCRGVLWSGRRWVWVTDPESLEVAVA